MAVLFWYKKEPWFPVFKANQFLYFIRHIIILSLLTLSVYYMEPDIFKAYQRIISTTNIKSSPGSSISFQLLWGNVPHSDTRKDFSYIDTEIFTPSPLSVRCQTHRCPLSGANIIFNSFHRQAYIT